MELLKNFLKEELNIELSRETEEKFRIYLRELKEWNKKINLTAIEKDPDIEVKHFIDSLEGLKSGISENGGNVLDIGSGAGFPGIPIRLAAQDIKLTIVESVGKKTEFIRNIVKKLGLSDVEIINDRSELLPDALRERFDYVLCRAVAPIEISLELALPWVKIGGFGIFYIKEIYDAQKISRVSQILGGEFNKEASYTLPIINETRKILTIKKIKPTALKFPRRPGVAKKKPL